MERDHWFCSTGTCPVVYFGRRELFTKTDVSAPVFEKEPPGNRVVCHCFGVTEEDVRRELRDQGRPEILERIKEGTRAGVCACETKNPRGICCTARVLKVVACEQEIMEELVSS